MSNSLLEAALHYARLGWYVFPCESAVFGDDTSGKAPIGSLVPNGKDDASIDPAQITAWWSSRPQANIGIATEPSGLVVLDVDISHGKQGAASLAEINNDLTITATQRTGSGGVHAVYLRGDADARQSIGIRDGLDIIGKGYVIVAPSVHYTGGTYEWINAIAPVPQPEILKTIQRTKRLARGPLEASDKITHAKVDDAAKMIAAAAIADAFPANGRHMTFLALAGALAVEGWDEDEITEFTVMVARLIPHSDQKAIDDRRPQARDSVAMVERGAIPANWGNLSQFIPQSALTTMQLRLGITDRELEWVKTASLEATSTIDLGSLGTISPEEIEAEIVNIKKPKLTKIGELAARKFPPVLSYPTQFADLNLLMGGGISTQMLQILLGPPGAGKTAWFVSVALFLSAQVPTLYVSTELQHNELVARFASPILRVPWRDIVRGKAINDDGSLLTEEHLGQILADHNIWIIAQDEIYQAGEKALELIARTAQAIKEATGVAPVVMVDYLQELARGDGDKARAMNTKVAITMRMLSQRLDCAWFAVSSVSRAGYGKAATDLRTSDNPEVYLAFAKESGDIDYAAATIMFLDVSSERDGNGWKMARMAVAKSRHGETGFAGQRFMGAFGLWEMFVGAVTALSEEARSGAKVEKSISDIQQRILSKVRELGMLAVDPGGVSQLKGRTELKVLMGGNAMQAGVAIDQLLRDGKLTEQLERYMSAAGKYETRRVIMLAGSSDGSTETAIDMKELLSGITGTTRT